MLSCSSSDIKKEWREIVDAQQEEVKTALQNFLHAFENCDLTAMERFFAPDCVSFDQVVAGSGRQPVSDFTPYRRCAGMPPAMKRTALELPTRNPGPPYHSLTPQDLLIQIFGDAAVATFHIERDGILRRRTIVFVRRNEDWKIVHLHASSVQVDG
jgi:ketosteroid isomerase-like protein